MDRCSFSPYDVAVTQVRQYKGVVQHKESRFVEVFGDFGENAYGFGNFVADVRYMCRPGKFIINVDSKKFALSRRINWRIVNAEIKSVRSDLSVQGKNHGVRFRNVQ